MEEITINAYAAFFSLFAIAVSGIYAIDRWGDWIEDRIFRRRKR